MIRITEPILGSGYVVEMYNGFEYDPCVLDLWKRVVYASVNKKNKRYWPKGISGEMISDHMHGSNIIGLQVLHAVSRETLILGFMLRIWMTLNILALFYRVGDPLTHRQKEKEGIK